MSGYEFVCAGAEILWSNGLFQERGLGEKSAGLNSPRGLVSFPGFPGFWFELLNLECLCSDLTRMHSKLLIWFG